MPKYGKTAHLCARATNIHNDRCHGLHMVVDIRPCADTAAADAARLGLLLCARRPRQNIGPSERGPAGTHNSKVQLRRKAELPNTATEGGTPAVGGTPAEGGIVPRCAAVAATADVASNTVEEGRPSGWGGASLATAATTGKEPPPDT